MTHKAATSAGVKRSAEGALNEGRRRAPSPPSAEEPRSLAPSGAYGLSQVPSRNVDFRKITPIDHPLNRDRAFLKSFIDYEYTAKKRHAAPVRLLPIFGFSRRVNFPILRTSSAQRARFSAARSVV